MLNFTLKFQVVAEEKAKKLLDDTFSTLQLMTVNNKLGVHVLLGGHYGVLCM